MLAAAPPFLEESIIMSIKCLVIDEIGEPVPSATVVILSSSKALKVESSDLDGQVQFSNLSLQTGIHVLRASKSGYEADEEELLVSREMENSTVILAIRVNAVVPVQQQTLQKMSGVVHQQATKEGPPEKEDPSLNRPADRMGWAIKPDEGNAAMPAASIPPQVVPEDNFYRVRVFFATDRNDRDERDPKNAFGGDRSQEGRLSLGICGVSVPKTHRVGEIESPNIFKLQFRKNPEKHIVVLDLVKMREVYYLESLGMMAGQSPEQSALVFIHGYCVTFIEAVRRTAQLAFDLDFRGVPICYSWPSTGKYSGYMADEASVEWTVPHLLEFLNKIANLEGIKTIHLIAHSMGNRALVNCLDRIAQVSQSGARPKARFHQTILAAPDIDAGLFRQLAQRFTNASDRTTLYASSGDFALQMSQQFHKYPRAGESGPKIVVVPRIDTVDVSTVPAGFLGHSYYGSSRSVLTDVYELIKSGSPPPRFGLRQSSGGSDVYWIFVP
jgi:esterase/lipase superfamily enzyme